ncbi:MAG: hypothetical protein IJ320_07675 [Phascolarctobacterium sp.]|nr:hypothetical protein [Phascolarctobacterium sp.]
MYNLFTQCLTLSVIFFVADYALEFIKVVTLGGLVAGSFLFGAWATLTERLARRLPNFTGKAAVCAAVLLGAQGLSAVLPGYEVEPSEFLVVCLIIYSAIAIYIGRFLNSEV